MVFYDKLSDKELSLLLNNGDRLAFTEIYNRYKGVLFVHAYRMLNDRLEAEDLIHDLFATLWSRATAYNPEIPLNHYLYRSVKNRVLDIFQHKKVAGRYMDSLQGFIDADRSVTDGPILEKELIRLIEREVSLLPKKMREVFELSRNRNMSYLQIAAKLNISDKTVKKQVSNAIRILRGKLGSLTIFVFFL